MLPLCSSSDEYADGLRSNTEKRQKTKEGAVEIYYFIGAVKSNKMWCIFAIKIYL